MLGHNAAPVVRAAWLNDMFLPPDAFDSVGHVAVDGDAFRWVPVFCDY